MVQVVYRPCYCTREDVRRALDIKFASAKDDAIDRAIVAAADAVEALTQRRFYPQDGTKKFDWPNYQYVYPWIVYLDQWEMAAQPTLVTTGSLLPSPIVIPPANFIMQPVNDGPPFTWLELRRDSTSAFGNNPTPQLDIALTGTFGFWFQTRPAGTVTSNVLVTDATINVSDDSSIGVGDVVIADSERMIVTGMNFQDTGAGFTSGITAASAADAVGGVANGAAFKIGEVIRVDFEWMFITDIVGNNLVVKRGWSGSQLATHTGADIWAERTLSVMRGQLGTVAAGHNSAAGLSVSIVPGLIRQLAVAEAETWLTQEPGAYSFSVGGLGGQAGQGVTVGRSTGDQAREGIPGAGVGDLRIRVSNSIYTRQARTRVI